MPIRDEPASYDVISSELVYRSGTSSMYAGSG